ncbi:serine hydrolase domain-containing protein [Salipiger abyssi]|uniref:serine hydrolase domain-containing protein n=1 Tax=Salipiger abyssi TaxID=1250539 RepID=UPI001A8E3D17|nr:serine hydrolase domain-containing protein [Salipiger abyssi]MBN9885932.1 beta-lactamase family protein [Salipiger abyssi]
MTVPDLAAIHSARIAADGRVTETGQPGLRFPYWSFTKTAIAICALALAERGALDLDAPVASAAYTLRQLLAHTAGLPDYTGLEAYRKAVNAEEDPWSRDLLLDRVLAQGPLFAPGEGWAYSNTGYMLAREHLEAVSGMGFARLFEMLIAEPLRLESVALATTRAEFARLHWPAAARYHPGWVYHGCLTGTARDAARLLHGLFSGALLGSDALRQLLETRPLGGAIGGRPWSEAGYALGLMSGRFGACGRAIGHSGGGPFSVNAVYHFPDRARPLTVASFAAGSTEGRAEHAAARIAGSGAP